MAELGNLSFGILYKDNPKQLDKIKERALKKLQDMNLVTKVSGSINKTDLVKSVREALGSEQFKIGVIVDKASTAKAVRDALDKAGLNTNYSASDLRAARARAETAKSEAYVNAQRELARQRAAAATRAELGLASARERSTNAARTHASATLNMNGAMGSQISITGQLSDQMLSLYSVYTLERFVRGLIEIGGEFEQQELALSAMLNDAGKAHEIFGKIKNLAVVSPFGVRELNNYTKQLKAFSIPYNELYETTKRLADISAGVGVDMGRIILAYGQVRSAAFLRGQELRQFTEAGIPMVEALADKFSKLENRVVSAGEVIDMISKKKVSFEDVKDVLWGMTGEGGQFNNMQEVLSESLSAKWKNLGDAIDIMMADIAQSSNGMLKGVAEGLTTLTYNWEALIPVISAAVIAFGSQRVVAFAVNRAMGEENVLLIKGALALKQKAASNLIVAQSYRTLNAAEKGVIVSSKTMSTSDWKLLASSGQLTKEYALRLMALGKLKSGQAGHIAQLLGITKAEMKAALSTSRYTVMMYSLGVGIKSVGLALKSLVWNPYTAIFAGLALVMSGWQKMEQKSEDMKQRIKDMSQTSNEGFKKLNSEARKFTDINPFSAKESSLITSIEKIKEVLKDYSPVWADTFKNVFAVDDEGKQINSLAEQYEKLRNSLNNVKEGYRILAEIKSAAEFANSDTDGWFDESFAENLKDASKAYNEMGKRAGNITTDYVKYYEAMQKVIDSNKDFAKIANGASLRNQLMLLRAFPKALQDFGEYTRDAQGNYNVMFIKFNESVLNYKKNLDVAGKDLHGFMKNYKSRLQGLGIDLNKLSEPQKIAIALNVTQFMDTIEGLNPELRKIFLRESLEREFKIKVTTEFEDKLQKLTQIQEKFDEATNKKFTAQIKTSTDPNEIIDIIQKAYKEADSAVKQMKPVLLKFGVKFDKEGKADLDSAFNVAAPWIKSMAEEFNKRQNEIIGGNSGATILGFSIKDVKDSKKDAFAEQMKERVNLLKNAYSEYKKWKDIVGKEEASNKIKGSGIFDSLFKGKEPVDIDNYKEELNKLLNQLDNKTKERRELKVSIRKVLLDIDADAAKDTLEKSLSDIQKYISDTTKKWKLYKNIYDTTGDKDVAVNLAFGGIEKIHEGVKSLIDELKYLINKETKDSGINIDDMLSMSDKELVDKFGAKSKILISLLKELRTAQREENDEENRLYLESLSSTMGYYDKKRKIIEEYAKKIEIARKKGDNATASKLGSERDAKIQEIDPSTILFYTSILSYTKEQANDIGNRLKAGLVKQMENGTLSAKEFCDTLEKINSQLEKSDKRASALSSFMKGGTDGLLNWFKEKGNSYVQKGSSDYKLASEDYTKYLTQFNDAMKVGDKFSANIAQNGMNTAQSSMQSANGMMKMGQGMQNFASKAQGAIGMVDMIVTAIDQGVKAMQQIVDSIAELAESRGIDTDSGGWADVKGAMTVLSDFNKYTKASWDSLKNGDVAGATANFVSSWTSVFTNLNRLHDKKLDKSIEKSQQRVEKLKHAYEEIERSLEHFLGSGTELKVVDAENDIAQLDSVNSKIEAIRNKKNINIFDLYKLKNYSKESEKLQKRVTAYNEGGAYGYQRALMQEQLSEVEQQRRDELDKKKTDNGKVEDYNNQIAELKQQIKGFAEDAADSLYGINLKDWASQLGDALYEAWQKGEDGAEAFKKKAAEIMGDVMNSVMKLTIIEPAMKNLQTKLFGEDGMSGMFGNDFSLDDKEIESIADYLMGISSKTDDYYDAMDKLNKYMEKKYGVSMKEEAEGSGLSKGIEGVTEDTANLLASYLNSVRADVAAKLVLVRQIVNEYFPRANFLAEAQLTELKAISRNTANNVALVTEIRDMLSAARLSKDRGFWIK